MNAIKPGDEWIQEYPGWGLGALSVVSERIVRTLLLFFEEDTMMCHVVALALRGHAGVSPHVPAMGSTDFQAMLAKCAECGKARRTEIALWVDHHVNLWDGRRAQHPRSVEDMSG